MTHVLPVIDAAPSEACSPNEKPAGSTWTDWLGIVAAIGCAIHCAAMPFVIAYLPALGLNFLADEAFHKWMAIGCFAIALSAFIPGFRKHGRFTPVIVGSVGLAMISFAAFGSAGECCPSSEIDAQKIASGVAAVCPDAACEKCPSESSTDSASSPVVAASIGLAGDTDANCDDCPTACQSESGSGMSPNMAGSARWLGFVLPWLTPLGGLALVGAHLLNRRHCSCCSRASAQGDSAANDSTV